MFGRINKLLQDSIMGQNLQDINPELPSGIIEIQEGFLRSIPIPVAPNVYLQGRFDILTKLTDGTHTIIDFKITNPDTEKVLKYTSQLHAYKFALENPHIGKPLKISKMGIVSVNPEEMKLVNGKIQFTAVPRFHPVEENMESFFSLLKEVSGVLNGPVPAESATCSLCKYRAYFKEKPEVTMDIPF